MNIFKNSLLKHLKMALRHILRMLPASWLYCQRENNLFKFLRPWKNLRMVLWNILRMLPAFSLYCRRQIFWKIDLDSTSEAQNSSQFSILKMLQCYMLPLNLDRGKISWKMGLENISEWISKTCVVLPASSLNHQIEILQN